MLFEREWKEIREGVRKENIYMEEERRRYLLKSIKRYNKNAILLAEDTINGYNHEDLKAKKKYEAFEKYIDDIDYEMKNKMVDDFICYACKNQSLTKPLSVVHTTELGEVVGLYYSDVRDVFYEDGDLKTQFEFNIIRPIYENDLREILYNNKSFELLVLDVYDLMHKWRSYFDLKAKDDLTDEWQNLTDNEAWDKLLKEAIEELIDYEIRSLKKTKRFQTINRELQFEIFDKLPKVWNIVYGSNKLEESN